MYVPDQIQQKRLVYLDLMFFVNWFLIPFSHIFQTPKTMIKVTQENYAYKCKPVFFIWYAYGLNTDLV
jgi:hypothetical protein